MIIEKKQHYIPTLSEHNNSVKLASDIMDGQSFRRQNRKGRTKRRRLC